MPDWQTQNHALVPAVILQPCVAETNKQWGLLHLRTQPIDHNTALHISWKRETRWCGEGERWSRCVCVCVDTIEDILETSSEVPPRHLPPPCPVSWRFLQLVVRVLVPRAHRILGGWHGNWLEMENNNRVGGSNEIVEEINEKWSPWGIKTGGDYRVNNTGGWE